MAALSKSAAVTLPLLLLLTDYLFQRKFTRPVLLEKVPYFIVSFLFGVLTLIFRGDVGRVGCPQHCSILDRLFLASYSAVFYIQRFFAPLDLSSYYPYPRKRGRFFTIHASFTCLP